MKAKILSSQTFIILALVLPITLASCRDERRVEIGYDGRPGDAFLSLEWEYDSPSYLDAGTSDIPYHFEYGQYYLTRPGNYYLYYEGEEWDGYGMAYYGWEIEYEIYRNYGSSGGPGYNGYDGRDSYLTIILSPYGPYTERWEKSISTSNTKVIEEDQNRIVVETTDKDYTIRVTYTRKIKSEG